MLKAKKNLTSYLSPLIWLFVSMLALMLMYLRKEFISFQNQLAEKIFMLFCTILVCVCILRVYISLIEFYYVYKNRRKRCLRIHHVREISLDALTHLLTENDIIEIKILFDNEVVTLGASSDSRHNSDLFFNKQYYIDSSNYISIEDFRESLILKCSNQIFKVITIDGCNPAYYKI